MYGAPHYVPFGGESWRDPYPLYRQLRDEEPVHFAPELDTYVLTRFADVYGAALDTETFSSARGISLSNEHEHLDLLPNLVMMDPPDHTRYRRLVNRGFSPRQIQSVEPALRKFVAGCVRRLREKASGDFVELVARPVPCFVVAHYLGVPEADRAMFDGWTQAIVAGAASGAITSAGDALVELYGYFTELVDAKRGNPGDDMVSDLLRADPDGVALRTEEILGYAFVMVAGGNDTATGLIAGAAELLTDHPTQRKMLIDDPSTIPGAVEEMLRYTSPVQGLCRVTNAEVTVQGRPIPADSRVMLCYGAANRDEREFGESADEFDITRPVKRLLTFSSGPHYCMGAPLARMQGRIVVEELLSQCPDFAVDAAAGRFAPGAFVRRYQSLPVLAGT